MEFRNIKELVIEYCDESKSDLVEVKTDEGVLFKGNFIFSGGEVVQFTTECGIISYDVSALTWKPIINVVKLCEYLQGTCKTLNDGCVSFGYEEDDLTEDDLNYIDNEIFLCTSCGWWCEVCDSVDNDEGENVCCDCVDGYGEDNDDED